MLPTYREIDAKSMLRKAGMTDPWFLARYSMNLYRGCEHGCLYCDGRAERYYVTGDFARDILVKRNAVEVLGRELDRLREPGFVFLGGGVCDAYQPVEERYQLARGVLELCRERRLPVQVLTKSALVERDFDVLTEIGKSARAVLSFSICTVDEELRRVYEPGAAPLSERWRLLARARELGIATGVMAMPLLPGLSDTPEQIAALVACAHENRVQFVCFGGLTLRPGAQRQSYLERLHALRPDLVSGYERLYGAARASGAPDPRYLARVDSCVRAALQTFAMPGRAPHEVFAGHLPTYAETAVLLEHQGFASGEPAWGGGPLGRAGWALQHWARSRLGRARSCGTFRRVENELADAIQEGRIAGVLGVSQRTAQAVEQVHERVIATAKKIHRD